MLCDSALANKIAREPTQPITKEEKAERGAALWGVQALVVPSIHYHRDVTAKRAKELWTFGGPKQCTLLSFGAFGGSRSSSGLIAGRRPEARAIEFCRLPKFEVRPRAPGRLCGAPRR